MGSTHMSGSAGGNGNGVGTNLSYAKFLFIVVRDDDEVGRTRLRSAGGHIARGFSNDFDLDDSRETPPQALESIQFFVRDTEPLAPALEGARPGIDRARYLAHVSSRYRPRLEEVGEEFRKRLGEGADVVALDGALRHPRYSSAEMRHFENQRSPPPRRSGRLSRNVIVLPIRKSADWWRQSPLERQTYFYPHVNRSSGSAARGHALAAESGIGALFRRVYHNPDGYERPNEYDFVSYFECDDAGLPVFDHVVAALRDVEQNPEWRYVEEGPAWRGRRVLRW